MVRIPLEAEETETWTFPISGTVIQRDIGGILLPRRFTEAAVEELKRHRLRWAGQYQQRPAPLGGNIIKRQDVATPRQYWTNCTRNISAPWCM